MRSASWMSAVVGALSVAAAATAWRRANLADQARRAAEYERDAALEQVAEMMRTARGAQRTFPDPQNVDFHVRRIRGSIDRFRLRNAGAKPATNVRFVIDPEDQKNRRVPTPQWLGDAPVTLLPNQCADFAASALSLVAGSWRIVFPAFVTVLCDEGDTPVQIDLPTAVVAEDGSIG
ncbi:hypothetical protein [Rhodococcus tibetensis]|uniref:Uncharacterized protein n=1 Tax=Rhodococcus tibetensis TaxID=2965064 RepID=A0ABT1Q8Q2_9NOCA|nr:hypothetical protein [Rhodococcus sp. FXJ9.536]MCQ4118627.1 hypothetical protein [Rhodococcus sp. FXJ9.536]